MSAIDELAAHYEWPRKQAPNVSRPRRRDNLKVYRVSLRFNGVYETAFLAVQTNVLGASQPCQQPSYLVKADASSLAAQVLRIPFACDPQHYKGDLPARTTVPIFTDLALKLMLDVFVPNQADRTSPYCSVLLAKSELLKKLPPTYIDVCHADPLCVPAIAYGKALEDQGVPVKCFVLEGMPHGSFVLFPDLPSSRTAWDSCVAGTKWALAGGK